jgi:hypothetical protein
MKSWKVALGLGAACCALPLVGGLAALGTALAAWAQHFLLAAALLLVLGAGSFGAWWWRRRRHAAAAACDCASSCSG